MHFSLLRFPFPHFTPHFYICIYLSPRQMFSDLVSFPWPILLYRGYPIAKYQNDILFLRASYDIGTDMCMSYLQQAERF